MRLRSKILQYGVFAGLTILATGCGGFHAKYSVSPLTFLLPGFGRVEAKQVDQNGDIQPGESTRELAQTENSQTDF